MKKNTFGNLLFLFFIISTFLVFVLFTFSKSQKTKPIFNKLEKSALVKKVPDSYSVWIPSWKVDKSLISLEGASAKVSYAMPVIYALDKNGRVNSINFNKYDELEKKLKGKNIKIMPTVTNVTGRGFDGNLVTLFLENKEENSVKLIELAREHNYSGYDIDFELIKQSDKQNFSDFVYYFSEILHQNKMQLSVTVHAQSERMDSKVSAGQDIRSISKNADFVRIMAYDFHNLETEPGPITPTKELKEVIEFSKTTVDIDKLAICLPLYGYEWDRNVGGGRPVEFDETAKYIFENLIEPKRDQDSGEMTYEYTSANKRYVVWYQDSQSLIRKVEIAKSFGVKNFCFWSLGGEDPNIWSSL